MKKGIILYSSQNGSTKKVAEKICKGLNENGCQASISEIDVTSPKHFDEFDFVGIGSPVYYFRPSYLVMDYIDSIVDLSNKPVFSFSTYGSEIGDGANWLRKKLAKRKAVDIGHFRCRGKHFFPGYTNRGYVFSPESPTEKELSKAEIFGKIIALNLISNQLNYVSEYDRRTNWILRFERFVTNKTFTKVLYSKFFLSNKKRCNSCGICSAICPTKNIEWKNGINPNWGSNCILCCACEIKCPNKAISTPISWFIFSPFVWYNIIRTKKLKISWTSSKLKL
jgi:flavodoxin/NAD-dependent dihydropyrimidine dehydrogenase PreA subunit